MLMNGSMNKQILVDNCARLAGMGVRIIPPRDAYGKHNLPGDDDLVAEVAAAVERMRSSEVVR